MKQIKLPIFLIITISTLLICSIPAMAQSKDAKLGESVNEYDRGSTKQKAEEENKKDLELMKEYYKGDGSEGDCFRLEQVQGVSCRLLRKAGLNPVSQNVTSYTCNDLNLQATVPYYEYYVPFQKLEHAEVPFTTAYLDKEIIEGFLKQSAEALYENGVDGAKQTTKRVVDTLKEMGFEGDQSELVDKLAEARKRILDEQEEKQIVPEFSLKENRFRPAFRGDGRYMETHVLPTEFDTVYREEYKNSWVHQGAVNAWITEKPPVPIWFSEFPDSILLMRYSELAREIEDIEMSNPTEIDNCVMKKTSLTNFKSELPEEMKAESKCLPGLYGTKFSTPFNFDKGTIYATQAATKRDWMGIKLAVALTKTKEYKALGEGAFHELQDEDGTDDKGRREHKHDLLQFLDERRQTAKDGKAKGCFAADENHYLPDIDWSKQKEANKNEEGEYFRTAHYRYIRGCPRCYAPTSTRYAPILK